nr:immunoglobulin light chain junction region [Macaca mulatta]
YMQAIQLPLTF